MIELTKQPVIVSPTEENVIELVVENQLDLQEHPNINVAAEENVAEAITEKRRRINWTTIIAAPS